MQSRPPKILFVSNEVRGLGHVSQALKIGAGINAELSNASMLLLTGSHMVHAFPLTRGLDVITIPAVVRSEGSLADFQSLRLPLAIEEVKRLRERVIREAALTYAPDLVLVDYRPAGVAGELLSTLRALKRRHSILVLLLRDILDDPPILSAKWRADRALSALPKYDEIWVYGCQDHYDPIREHRFPKAVARKVRFCGYLDVQLPAISREATHCSLGLRGERLVLVTIGNGLVGFPVLDAYVRALAYLPNDLAVFSIIVGGPGLPLEDYAIIEQRCRLVSQENPLRRTHFTRFTPHLVNYIAAADLVVSLGGYNTVTETLRLEKRSIVIPYYTASNKEQLIRASLLERFGLVRLLHPDQLSSESLAKTIVTALHDQPPTGQRLQELGFDFGGLQRTRQHVARLMARVAQPSS